MTIKVLHCITSLHPDGAQQTLLKLCRLYDRERFEFEVLSLRPDGGLEGAFKASGVKVHCLQMFRSLPTPGAAYALWRYVRAAQPDVLQGWMYHGNLAASAASRAVGGSIPVLWNIRRGLNSLDQDRPLSKLVIRINALLSASPDGIIYCAQRAAEDHEACGFAGDKRIIIPNGFDIERFHPAPNMRARLRSQLGLAEDTVLVGNAARFHPQKDHRSLIEAAAQVLKVLPDVHFVLAGRDVSYDNPELAGWIDAFGLRPSMHLLGQRQDLPELLAGLDLFCLSSILEGFPNALGEAMASGIPCVATDTGASRELVADCGQIVPTSSPRRLAAAMLELLKLSPTERTALGTRSREHICRTYPLERVWQLYQAQYENVSSTKQHTLGDNIVSSHSSRKPDKNHCAESGKLSGELIHDRLKVFDE